MSYFGEFDDITEPSGQHLISFLQRSRSFLFDVIRNRLVGYGQVNSLDFFGAEMGEQGEAFIHARDRDFEKIIAAVNHLPNNSKVLAKHGLVGPPQRSRLLAMIRVENRVGFFRTEEIIKKILEDIDNILDSTRSALESAKNESRPDASEHQSAVIDAEIGSSIQEIKKMIEILLHNARQPAGTAAARKGIPSRRWGYAGAAVNGQRAY